jgi:hypothetical protein
MQVWLGLAKLYRRHQATLQKQYAEYANRESPSGFRRVRRSVDEVLVWWLRRYAANAKDLAADELACDVIQFGFALDRRRETLALTQLCVPAKRLTVPARSSEKLEARGILAIRSHDTHSRPKSPLLPRRATSTDVVMETGVLLMPELWRYSEWTGEGRGTDAG